MKRDDKVKIHCRAGITVGTILAVTPDQIRMKSPKMGTLSVNRSSVRKLRKSYRGAVYVYHSFN